MKWRRKTAAIDTKHDYATVTLSIPVCVCGSAASDQSTDGSEYDVTGSHVGEAQLSAERDGVQFLRVGDDDDWTRRSERHRAVDLARRRSASTSPTPISNPNWNCCSAPGMRGWYDSRVVIVLDSGAVGPGFKSQPRRCRVTVLGKLFTP